MRVLIVGCGYVGMRLGKDLAEAGHAVFGLRRTPAGADELMREGIRPLAADVTKPAELERLPQQYDWVVYCAATSGGGTEDYRALYLEGARNLVAWLASRPPQKLLYTSSTSVYGQDDGSLVTEESPSEPATETGRILVAAERVFLEAAESRKLPAVVLRLAGIYGPGRGYWLKQFLSGEARLEGEGLRLLNMIHCDDVAGGIIAAVERGKAGEIYNAVDDEPVSQRVMFEWLANKLGRELPPVTAAASGSKRGATNKQVSNRKLKEQLAYRFKYPTFREGFAAELDRLKL